MIEQELNQFVPKPPQSTFKKSKVIWSSEFIHLVMGNVCLGSGSCCKPDRNNGAASYRGCHQGKSMDNPYLDPSPGIIYYKIFLDLNRQNNDLITAFYYISIKLSFRAIRLPSGISQS